MNAKGRAALASAVMLVTLFAGSARHIRSLQPGFGEETGFEARWPKSFEARWPKDLKMAERKSRKTQTPIPGMLYANRLPMVWIAEKEQTRLIIPSSTCPPRRGEPEGNCL